MNRSGVITFELKINRVWEKQALYVRKSISRTSAYFTDSGLSECFEVNGYYKKVGSCEQR